MSTKKYPVKCAAIASALILFSICTFVLFVSDNESPAAYALETSLKDGAVYSVVNKDTGYNLDINGASTDNLSSVIQWYGNNADNQKFVLKSAGNGEWWIYPYHVNRLVSVIDVNDNGTTDGTDIILYQTNGGNNQRFRIQQNNDGSYKILTKTSNFDMAVGIRNSSSIAGESCIQTNKNNFGTSWYFNEIWYNSDKGKFTGVSEPYTVPETHPIFGAPTLIGEQLHTKEVTLETYFGIPFKKGTINDKLVRIWKYATPVSVPVCKYGERITLDEFSEGMERRISVSYSYTNTYKEIAKQGFGYATTLSSELSNILNNSYNGIGLTSSSSFQSYIELTTEQTRSYTFSASVGDTFTISLPEKYLGSGLVLDAETRGLTYLYVAQVFEFDYDIKDSIVYNYRNIAYTLRGKTCIEESTGWILDTNSFVRGFNPYYFDSATNQYIYCGWKTDSVIYA